MELQEAKQINYMNFDGLDEVSFNEVENFTVTVRVANKVNIK